MRRQMKFYGVTGIFLSFLISHICLANEIILSPPAEVTEKCKDFFNELPKYGWKGAWIKVPLDWSKPKSKKYSHIFFYFEDKDFHNHRPILFLNGGPLVSFHEVRSALAEQTKKYDREDNHMFVMLDQRGVGCSTPSIPTELGIATMRKIVLYRTDSIVKDIEAIRKSYFENANWKIYAYSYGGVIAARYLIDFPDSANSYYVFSPGLFPSLKDFFAYRIVKQNEVWETFLKYAKDERLRNVPSLLDSQSRVCLPRKEGSPEVCGRAVLDGILAGIGQGPGRSSGTTENWDKIKNALVTFLDGDIEKFLIDFATPSLDFFRSPTIYPVFAMWEGDMSTSSGDIEKSCALAYRQVQKMSSLNIKNLSVDECRMVTQNLSSKVKESLKRSFIKGKKYITFSEIKDVLKRHSKIQFNLYTAENDSSVNWKALNPLIQFRGIKHFHFSDHGHSAWKFERKIWTELMANEN